MPFRLGLKPWGEVLWQHARNTWRYESDDKHRPRLQAVENCIILMKKTASYLLLSLTALFLLPAVLEAQAGEGWKLKTQTDGLRVYVRKPADSDINEVKIETVFPGDMAQAIAVLKDYESYPDWVYMCQEAKLLPSGHVYSLLKTPWPLDNCDYVGKSTITQHPQTGAVTIRLRNIDGIMDKKSGVTRLKKLDVIWVLTPQSNGDIVLEYRVKSDPGGNIPTWAINQAIDRGPTNTIKKYRAMVQHKRYAAAKMGDFGL